jgi:hypothetical protein
VWLVALAIPLILALLTKRFITVPAASVLTLLSALMFIDSSLTELLASYGTYLGALLVAAAGFSESRRARRLNEDLAAPRSDVNHLMQAEERRFIVALKSETPIAECGKTE